MNTKFYKEFQDKYPTILGSDRNISYTQFLEEMVTELQQINQNDLSGDVSNNEVAVCPKCGSVDIATHVGLKWKNYCKDCGNIWAD
jgi:ribosomal protein S27AE